MSETNLWTMMAALHAERFEQCCRAIMRGLGYQKYKIFTAPYVQLAFRKTLIRESTDKMFRTEESWLVAFIRTDSEGSQQLLNPALKAAQSAGVENLLLVLCGTLDSAVASQFHADAKRAGIRSVLLDGSLSAALVYDYCSNLLPIRGSEISFARLRALAIKQSRDATWRTQFQSLTAVSAPTRIRSPNDSSGMDEADLFRAVTKTGSFLLLGDPGSGKTTSLHVMAEELATAGARTPVLMLLNEYSGNLIFDIGRTISREGEPLPEHLVRNLLASGVMTVMLDGLNEVHPASLQARLQDEINYLTNPRTPTARSQWILSGRPYDYVTGRRAVEHLEKNQWLLQPLTPDLIYRFLSDGLFGGEQEAEIVYPSLGPALMEVCSNPLLLNMVLVVHNKLGKIPPGRGQIYQAFIDLLLEWGKKDAKRALMAKLSEITETKLSEHEYSKMALNAMTDLASVMITTSIPWVDARLAFVEGLKMGSRPVEAATLLLEDLVARGILKAQHSRISFFHHTFQEYFQALQMKGLPTSVLIPEGGVEGAKREAVVFLAGLLDSPNSLVERALKYDYMLAYDIIRGSSVPIEKKLQIAVGKEIWRDIRIGERWVGQMRPKALQFGTLAEGLGLTAEQLAREVIQSSNEIEIAESLLRFYQELGDLEKQREIYERLGIGGGEEIPQDLIFLAAITASSSGDYQRSIDLYTQHLAIHPDSASAEHNRASSYESLGKQAEALAGYRRAVELNGSSSYRTSLALMLSAMAQKDEAIAELRQAVVDSAYPDAHYELGQLIKTQNSEEALSHFERAVRWVDSPDKVEKFTAQLAESQEQNSRPGEAIRSLKQLIALKPTSKNVMEWKKRIARLRLEMDDIEKRRTTRERLREKEDILLSALAREVLGGAGLQVELLTSKLLKATNEKVGLPSSLTIAICDVPQITGSIIREAVHEARARIPESKHLLILTAAEAFEPDARMQLLAYRSDEVKVALITSLEAQEAFLRGDRACYELIDRSIRRTTLSGDPFKCTTVIHERLEFFGREEQIRDLRTLIQERQPFGLYGIHKIGKSSLLLQIRQALSAYSRDTTPIAIELDFGLHDASDLYRRILEKIPDETEVPQATISSSYLRRRLTEFQRRQQRQFPGHRILLVLDEYACLIPDRSGEIRIKDFLEALSTFKSLYQEEEWFNILPCGRTTALSRIARWNEGENPFIGILQERFLGPLNATETHELITTLGQKAGLSFEPNSIERIFALTSGHPLFTRTLGSWIRSECRDTRVTVQTVEKAATAYLNSRADRALLLAIYEDSLDTEEQRIVSELALSSKPLSRSQLTPNTANEQARRRIRDSIGNLIDTTVLNEDRQKRLSHRYELLRRAIEQEVQEQGS